MVHRGTIMRRSIWLIVLFASMWGLLGCNTTTSYTQASTTLFTSSTSSVDIITQTATQSTNVQTNLSTTLSSTMSITSTISTTLSTTSTIALNGLQFQFRDEWDGYVVVGYSGTLTEVTIPSTIHSKSVVGIGQNAFANKNFIVSLGIPDSIRFIEYSAFRNMTGLTSIHIPPSVQTIGEGALRGCSSLVSLSIPFSGLSSEYTPNSSENLFGAIFGNSFYQGSYSALQYYYDTNFEIFFIPSTLREIAIHTTTSIPFGAFANLSSIERIIIGDSVTLIGPRSFQNSQGIVEVQGGSNLTSISGSAFDGTDWLDDQQNGLLIIGKVLYKMIGESPRIVNNIPSSVETIADLAFSYQYSLEEIIIPEGVKFIGIEAFMGCSNLYSVQFPQSLEIIHSHAFASNYSLTSVSFEEGLLSIGDYAFYENVILAGSIVIPDTTLSIGQGAFMNCYNIQSISIGKNVSLIGGSAFFGTNGLQDFQVDSDNLFFSSIEGVLFSKNMERLLRYPVMNPRIQYLIPNGVITIDEYAFAKAIYLEEVIMSSSIVEAKKGSFMMTSSLLQITLSENLIVISEEMFSYAMKLQEIVIPNKVIMIDAYAFENCYQLQTVTIGKQVEEIASNAFVGSKAIQEYVVHLDNPTYYHHEGVLFSRVENVLVFYPIGNTRLIYQVPSGVQIIGSNSFAKAEYVKEVVLSSSVERIDFQAFQFAKELEKITFASGLSTIGDSAFEGCAKLAEINFSTGLKEIHYRAFKNIQSITSLALPYGLQSIGASAFENNPQMTSITIPSTVHTIFDFAFEGCSSLVISLHHQAVPSTFGEYWNYYDYWNELQCEVRFNAS
jgi:hypothetical protein